MEDVGTSSLEGPKYGMTLSSNVKLYPPPLWRSSMLAEVTDSVLLHSATVNSHIDFAELVLANLQNNASAPKLSSDLFADTLSPTKKEMLQFDQTHHPNHAHRSSPSSSPIPGSNFGIFPKELSSNNLKIDIDPMEVEDVMAMEVELPTRSPPWKRQRAKEEDDGSWMSSRPLLAPGFYTHFPFNMTRSFTTTNGSDIILKSPLKPASFSADAQIVTPSAPPQCYSQRSEITAPNSPSVSPVPAQPCCDFAPHVNPEMQQLCDAIGAKEVESTSYNAATAASTVVVPESHQTVTQKTTTAELCILPNSNLNGNVKGSESELQVQQNVKSEALTSPHVSNSKKQPVSSSPPAVFTPERKIFFITSLTPKKDSPSAMTKIRETEKELKCDSETETVKISKRRDESSLSKKNDSLKNEKMNEKIPITEIESEENSPRTAAEFWKMAKLNSSPRRSTKRRRGIAGLDDWKDDSRVKEHESASAIFWKSVAAGRRRSKNKNLSLQDELESKKSLGIVQSSNYNLKAALFWKKVASAQKKVADVCQAQCIDINNTDVNDNDSSENCKDDLLFQVGRKSKNLHSKRGKKNSRRFRSNKAVERSGVKTKSKEQFRPSPVISRKKVYSVDRSANKDKKKSDVDEDRSFKSYCAEFPPPGPTHLTSTKSVAMKSENISSKSLKIRALLASDAATLARKKAIASAAKIAAFASACSTTSVQHAMEAIALEATAALSRTQSGVKQLEKELSNVRNEAAKSKLILKETLKRAYNAEKVETQKKLLEERNHRLRQTTLARTSLCISAFGERLSEWESQTSNRLLLLDNRLQSIYSGVQKVKLARAEKARLAESAKVSAAAKEFALKERKRLEEVKRLAAERESEREKCLRKEREILRMERDAKESQARLLEESRREEQKRAAARLREEAMKRKKDSERHQLEKYLLYKQNKALQLQQQKLQEEKSKSLTRAKSASCVVCYHSIDLIALLPCGHRCVCSSCSLQLSSCPICRSSIERRTKIYDSGYIENEEMKV